MYKTYGPHLALLYGKEEILKKLPNQNHEFLEGQVPYTLNPGGPNHEELSCLVGIYEYFNNLTYIMDTQTSKKEMTVNVFFFGRLQMIVTTPDDDIIVISSPILRSSVKLSSFPIDI